MIPFVLFIAAVANPATAPDQENVDPPEKKDRIICKSQKFVGSHVSERICKTETEWRIGKEDAQRALDDRGRGGNYENPTGPN